MLISETAQQLLPPVDATKSERAVRSDLLTSSKRGTTPEFRETLGRHVEKAELVRDEPAEPSSREVSESVPDEVAQPDESEPAAKVGPDDEVVDADADTKQETDRRNDDQLNGESQDQGEEVEDEANDPDGVAGDKALKEQGEPAIEEATLVRRLLADPESARSEQDAVRLKQVQEEAEIVSKAGAVRSKLQDKANIAQTVADEVSATRASSSKPQVTSGESETQSLTTTQPDVKKSEQAALRAEQDGSRQSKHELVTARRELADTGEVVETEEDRLARARSAVELASRSLERPTTVALEAVATDRGRSSQADRAEISQGQRVAANQEAAATGTASPVSPSGNESSSTGGQTEDNEQHQRTPERQDHRRSSVEASVSNKLDGEMNRSETTATLKLVDDKIGGKESNATNTTRSGEPSPQQQRVEAAARRGVMAAVHQRGGTVAIKLTPESLGSLRVQMDMGAGRVSVRIESTTDVAHRALEQSIGSLRAALESKGLKVDSIQLQQSATATMASNTTSSQNTSNQQQGHQSNQNGQGANAEHDAGGRESRGRDDDREDRGETPETRSGNERSEQNQRFRLALDATV
ncbi:MAG: flagellar hook-length control protein FliK [Planctomycetota bacterium]